VIPRQACLFRILDYGRVECEWDLDRFSEAVKDCRYCEIAVYGHPDQSMIPIVEAGEFFNVKPDWDYYWEFRGNEMMAPDVLVAVIQAW